MIFRRPNFVARPKVFGSLRTCVVAFLVTVVSRPGAGASTHRAGALQASCVVPEGVRKLVDLRCGVAYGGGGPMGHALKISDDTSVNCLHLYSRALKLNDEAKYQAAYDTFKIYVEDCPFDDFAWLAFDNMRGPLTQLAGSSSEPWYVHNLWLRSVLYFKHD